MAEAIMNQKGFPSFTAYSAGSHPKGTVHQAALHQLELAKLPTASLRSKDWSEFAGPGAPVMDFVFTVCDQTAKEMCPIWPGHPMKMHWGVPDPVAVQGSPPNKSRKPFAKRLLFWIDELASFSVCLSRVWTNSG